MGNWMIERNSNLAEQSVSDIELDGIRLLLETQHAEYVQKKQTMLIPVSLC